VAVAREDNSLEGISFLDKGSDKLAL